ncbi:hypothetical protein [Sodalis sp.]|uniref:hypothetical protein n=1 Tax=Sodalis sp. (in: enterobacteria) TaxID=1898979 RepID=UPI003873BC76
MAGKHSLSSIDKSLTMSVSHSTPLAQSSHEVFTIPKKLGTPLLVNRSSNSLLNRWIREHMLNELTGFGGATVAFTPLIRGCWRSAICKGWQGEYNLSTALYLIRSAID